MSIWDSLQTGKSQDLRRRRSARSVSLISNNSFFILVQFQQPLYLCKLCFNSRLQPVLHEFAVDDNSISLAAIEQELKRDYEVIPVNSGERALQYLKRERPNLILIYLTHRLSYAQFVRLAPPRGKLSYILRCIRTRYG